MPSKKAPIYQIKISLNNIRPSIWRRFLVPANIHLDRLHDVLQVVMGWEDEHLHQYVINGIIYGIPNNEEDFFDLEVVDESDMLLNQVAQQTGDRLRYDYDFGDSWHHTLILEKILPPDPTMRYPRCLEGKRACPPEDVGGIGGYQYFLEAIRDPRHEEHDEYLEWAGGSFDPEEFDLEAINQKLRKLKKPGALDVDDWLVWPEFPPYVEPIPDPAWLDKFARQYHDTANALPLRRDMITLLNYLRDQRVTGTQSTGNLPLKAAKEICALLVNPPPMQITYGSTSIPVRSSAEIPSLRFLHILAAVGGWIHGSAGRRWVLTASGEEFLALPPGKQAWQLFHAWWTKANWGILADYAPQNFPTSALRASAERHLPELAAGSHNLWTEFAIQLIKTARVIYSETEQSYFAHMIDYVLLEPLDSLGVVERSFSPHPLLGADHLVTDGFFLTEFGCEMLKQIRQA